MSCRTFGLIAALSAVAALSLSACTPGGKAAPANEIRYASMKDIRNINPHLYLGEMSAQAMVFEPLVMNMKDGSVSPWLAESWDISEDGKVYTFHLRKGVKYSDGTEFTAQSVKQNFDAILANFTRHAWLDMIREIDKTEAVDPLTFRLTLKHAYFPTLIELGLSRPFRFISPKCMKDGGTKDGVSCLAGTGPWVLAEHKNNQFALFKQNPSYWGAKPHVQSVRWNVMPDSQTMLLALQKGEIDLIFGADGDQLSSDAFAKLEKEGKFATRESAPIASRAILLNSKRPITGDPLVREAIQRAINRGAIVKNVLNGKETAAETLFAKNVPLCDVPLEPRPYDPEAAKAMMEKAGWKAGADGIREKDGKRCLVEFYFNSRNAQEKTIAETIQADLRKIGIEMKVIGEEKQAFLDRQRTGQFDLQYSLSWGAPYDPQSYLSSWRIPAHGDFQAQIGLKDKKVIDEEIGALMIEADAAKRASLARDILTRVHASGVYFPVSYSRTKAIHSARLRNVDFAVTQYEIPFEKMSLESVKK